VSVSKARMRPSVQICRPSSAFSRDRFESVAALEVADAALGAGSVALSAAAGASGAGGGSVRSS
jgi:hypothetical protein